WCRTARWTDSNRVKKGAVRPWTSRTPVREGCPVIGAGRRFLSGRYLSAPLDPAGGRGGEGRGRGVAARGAAAPAQGAQLAHGGAARGREQRQQRILQRGEALELRPRALRGRPEEGGSPDPLLRAVGELLPPALAGEREL